jgi:hypothetical protein
VDWRSLRVETDPSSASVTIHTPFIDIAFADGGEEQSYDNIQVLPLIENEPYRASLSHHAYYELLDADKRILLIGFK